MIDVDLHPLSDDAALGLVALWALSLPYLVAVVRLLSACRSTPQDEAPATPEPAEEAPAAPAARWWVDGADDTDSAPAPTREAA